MNSCSPPLITGEEEADHVHGSSSLHRGSGGRLGAARVRSQKLIKGAAKSFLTTGIPRLVNKSAKLGMPRIEGAFLQMEITGARLKLSRL